MFTGDLLVVGQCVLPIIRQVHARNWTCPAYNRKLPLSGGLHPILTWIVSTSSTFDHRFVPPFPSHQDKGAVAIL